MTSLWRLHEQKIAVQKRPEQEEEIDRRSSKMDVEEENFFGSLCRTCAINNAEHFIFRTEKEVTVNVPEMLFYCTSQEATLDDKLPKRMCITCLSLLQKFYEFKKRAIETTEYLLLTTLNKENKDSALNNIPLKGKIINNLNVRNLYITARDTERFFNDKQEQTNKRKDNNIAYNPLIKSFKTDSNSIIKHSLSDDSQEPIKKYVCECCGKIFGCSSNLSQHKKSHTETKPFSCTFCGKKFKRTEHLSVHKRIHTGERPFSCPTCGKKFTQKASLSVHFRTHTGEKMYKCSICSRSFSQSASLIYHTRSHTGETPYACTVCGKGFTHSGNLNIHMRFHDNERPHGCQVCKKTFHTSSYLNIHMAQHTGLRPHQCTVCGKAFARRERLKMHIIIHSGKKPFHCTKCTKRYTQKSHLNRHMKMHII